MCFASCFSALDFSLNFAENLVFLRDNPKGILRTGDRATVVFGAFVRCRPPLLSLTCILRDGRRIRQRTGVHQRGLQAPLPRGQDERIGCRDQSRHLKGSSRGPEQRLSSAGGRKGFAAFFILLTVDKYIILSCTRLWHGNQESRKGKRVR
jgi:hypothetical protein